MAVITPFRQINSRGREIANYFQNHNADSIKKRYQVARRVLMETFTPEDVFLRPLNSSDSHRIQN